MSIKNILPLSIFMLLIACSQTKQEGLTESQTVLPEKTKTNDLHSHANMSEVNTTHLHLDLNVDFDKKSLIGSVKHTINNSNKATKIIFDTKQLVVTKVLLNDNEETTFIITEGTELLGNALTVTINEDTKSVTLFYSTLPESEALQWLSPQQTAGKAHPFLFTQGEAVLTRSWIPCQDSPSNRITYSANITVPSHLMALMSATNPTEKSKDGTYSFEMTNPIPSYLIALAVGDIAFKDLGGKTGVYAEPSMLEKSANEFPEVKDMVVAAEELYGEYKWGRFDILVLPPSFPFGGMENPKLTFATPTIIAGDKSLVSLIAHELAHSWSGNLVTNATWDDFWLNEGFTVYFENRIMEKIFGTERSDMLLSIEYQELLHENNDILSGSHPEDTHLKLDLEGRNPDDGMTGIAYVKGALFLKTMENAVGREKFDVFINNYFNHHAFQTITTEDFIIYTNENLLKPNNSDFNMDEWIFENGIPESCVKIESDRFKIIDTKALLITEMKSIDDLNINKEDLTTQEWIRFIRQIPIGTSVEKMAAIDNAFNMTDRGNAEVMSEWYIQSIRNGYTDINASMESFLIEVGRRKFLEPIYTELAKTEKNLILAKEIYAKARPNYHAISFNTVDEILNW
jgi:leukotriene-A4 hydrolase